MWNSLHDIQNFQSSNGHLQECYKGYVHFVTDDDDYCGFYVGQSTN